MLIVPNASRHLRAFIRMTKKTLYVLSPKQLGQPSWRFAMPHEGKLIVLGKPVRTRTIARSEGPRRFGGLVPKLVKGNVVVEKAA